MRKTLIAILSVGFVAVLSLSDSAHSRPAQRGVAASKQATAKPAARKVTQKNLKRARDTRRGANQQRNHSRPIAAIVRVEPDNRPEQRSETSRARPMFGWPSLVVEARKYIGTNPTNRSRLWCATFMNFVLAKTGYAGTGSDAARSFASYGRRVSEPRVGAIAVLTRGRNGGHVGVVTGIDTQGNPVIVSGNHGRRVAESVYPRKRVIAYVMPVEDTRPTRYAALASQAQAAPRSSDIDSEGGLPSPITELLAAINSEAPRSERAPAPQPVQAAPQPRPVPQRLVQQVAGQDTREQAARQMPVAPSQRYERRSLPLDPALARLFGGNRR